MNVQYGSAENIFFLGEANEKKQNDPESNNKLYFKSMVIGRLLTVSGVVPGGL